jgi:uridine kinase
MAITSEETLLKFETHFKLVILQDSFYCGLTAEESAHAQDYNFDHPSTAFSVSCSLLVVAI